LSCLLPAKALQIQGCCEAPAAGEIGRLGKRLLPAEFWLAKLSVRALNSFLVMHLSDLESFILSEKVE